MSKVSGMIAIPASLRSDFIHIPGTPIHIALESTIHITGIRNQRPGCEIVYLVTAKHVLQDADGAFLPSVRIRMNLRSPVGDAQFGFISDIPVTDPQGNLLWFTAKTRPKMW